MTAGSVRAPARAGSRVPGRLETWLENSPWHRGDLIVLAGRLVVGVIGIVVGWAGCSGTLDWNQQQAWVAVGIGGVVIALAGVGAWLQAGTRAVKEEQSEVLALAQERLGLAEPDAAADEPAPARLVSGTGMTMFHRPECVLARGKATHVVTRREAAKLTPCTVCRP